MSRVIAAMSDSAIAFPIARLRDCLHRLMQSAFNPYRPELYYMRGPGPAWQKKHSQPR